MKPEIHFIGLGDSGSKVAGHFFKWGLQGRFSCINTSLPEQNPEMIKFLWCPSADNTQVLKNMELNRPEMKPQNLLTDVIRQLVSGNEIYILLTGLGGYTGTNLCIQLTKHLIITEKKFHLICSMPFLFEGHVICKYAARALCELKIIAKPTVFSLNEILRKYENLKLQTAFEMAKDEFLWEFMRTRIV